MTSPSPGDARRRVPGIRARTLPVFDRRSARGDGATLIAGMVLVGAWFGAKTGLAGGAPDWFGYAALALLFVLGLFAPRLWLAALVVFLSLAVLTRVVYFTGTACDGVPGCPEDEGLSGALIWTSFLGVGATLVGGGLRQLARGPITG